jgi:tetratricopeptide (TPR) repeat protein/serine/threonine protein kinase
MTEESIFLEALQKETPQDRAAFLEGACGSDAALRRAVELLLQAHEQAGEFLQGRAEVGFTTEPGVREGPGSVIGSYKLLQQIGEGGMGVVFMAEQTQPVQRKVALKIIKPGMDSRQVIARFEAERQALALMDHPNIARVLDAGETPPAHAGGTHRPYFVMELVKGVPITKYCDEKRLTPRERLELFVPVCQAVQHAHQKGVIHRDLKPSNVLVALYDGQPVPKVIDFGVAKATGQKLTERTLFTEFGAVVGTLEYMSPEQAELNQLDIDTRSDVYALGVLLYELLTGTTPLERQRLKQAGLLEALRLIREEETRRPSTRLSTVEDLPTIAASRGLEPKKLSSLVRGELDWIVMKALEKDRNRRYETASALARDVERYLHDEPVLACPPSVGYQVRKFVRRNRRVLMTLALLGMMLLVVAGAVGGSVGWNVWQRAARQVKVNDEAGRAVEEASMHADRALTLIDQPSQWEAALAAASSELKRGQALAEGDDELLYPEMRERIAALAARLQVDHKDRALVAAVERIRLESSQPNVKENRFQNEEAPPRYRDAFQAYGMATTNPPNEAAALLDGKHAGIRAALIASLDDWLVTARLATTSMHHGRRWRQERNQETQWLIAVLALADPDGWRSQVRAALREGGRKPLEALAQRPKAIEQVHATLTLFVAVLRARGAEQSAIGLLEQAQARNPGDFWTNHTLASTLMHCKRPRVQEGITFYRVALALRPDNPGVYLNLGNALRAAGDLPQAINSYQKAIALAPDYATAYSHLGGALLEHSDLPASLAAHRKAIALAPNDASFRTQLGIALHAAGDLAGAITAYRQAAAMKRNYAVPWNRMGGVLQDTGDLVGAIAAYQKAIAINPRFADAYSNLGAALRARGDLPGAIAAQQKAVALAPDLAKVHFNLGLTLYARKDYPGAIAAYRKAVDLDPEMARGHHNLALALKDSNDLPGAIAAYQKATAVNPRYAEAHAGLAMVLQLRGDLSGAIAAYQKALAVRPRWAQVQDNLGIALFNKGDLAGASIAYRKAIACDPKWANAHSNLGLVLCLQGKLDEAAAECREALRIEPGSVAGHNNLGLALKAKGDLPGAIAAFRTALQSQPDSVDVLLNLGSTLSQKGAWDEATAPLDKARQLQPHNAHPWFFLAINFLGAETLPAYRRVCAGMLNHFDTTRTPATANLVLYACVATPDAVADPAALILLAKIAAVKPGDFAHTPGAALYRAGKYEAAVRYFDAREKVARLRAWDCLFLAMAQHRLGKFKEARRSLDRAARWIAAAKREEAEGKRSRWAGWFAERVVVERLRREAETLLKESAPAQPAPQERPASPAKPFTERPVTPACGPGT